MNNKLKLSMFLGVIALILYVIHYITESTDPYLVVVAAIFTTIQITLLIIYRNKKK